MERKWETYHGEELIDSGFHDVSWEAVRSVRDQALKDSDWRALKDVTLSTAWRDFRAALRDLPQDFPDSANDAYDNWPQAPE